MTGEQKIIFRKFVSGKKEIATKSINQRNLLDKKLSGVSAVPGEACPLVREYIATL